MQNIGFLFSVEPALRKFYSGPTLYAAMKRHLEVFNTQPFMASFTLGMVVRMEERAALLPQAEMEREWLKISAMKKALSTVTAAIGDRLFWGTVRSCGFATLLFVWWLAGFKFWMMAPWSLRHTYYSDNYVGIVLGVAAGLAVYNALPVWIRWRGISYGYICEGNRSCGMDYFNWQNVIKVLRRWGYALSILVATLFVATFFQEVIKAGLNRETVISLICVPLLGVAALFFRRRGISSVYLYLTVIGLAMLYNSFFAEIM